MVLADAHKGQLAEEIHPVFVTHVCIILRSEFVFENNLKLELKWPKEDERKSGQFGCQQFAPPGSIPSKDPTGRGNGMPEIPIHSFWPSIANTSKVRNTNTGNNNLISFAKKLINLKFTIFILWGSERLHSKCCAINGLGHPNHISV